jgi:hypothetical protein
MVQLYFHVAKCPSTRFSAFLEQETCPSYSRLKGEMVTYARDPGLVPTKCTYLKPNRQSLKNKNSRLQSANTPLITASTAILRISLSLP